MEHSFECDFHYTPHQTFQASPSLVIKDNILWFPQLKENNDVLQFALLGFLQETLDRNCIISAEIGIKTSELELPSSRKTLFFEDNANSRSRSSYREVLLEIFDCSLLRCSNVTEQKKISVQFKIEDVKNEKWEARFSEEAVIERTFFTFSTVLKGLENKFSSFFKHDFISWFVEVHKNETVVQILLSCQANSSFLKEMWAIKANVRTSFGEDEPFTKTVEFKSFENFNEFRKVIYEGAEDKFINEPNMEWPIKFEILDLEVQLLRLKPMTDECDSSRLSNVSVSHLLDAKPDRSQKVSILRHGDITWSLTMQIKDENSHFFLTGFPNAYLKTFFPRITVDVELQIGENGQIRKKLEQISISKHFSYVEQILVIKTGTLLRISKNNKLLINIQLFNIRSEKFTVDAAIGKLREK